MVDVNPSVFLYGVDEQLGATKCECRIDLVFVIARDIHEGVTRDTDQLRLTEHRNVGNHDGVCALAEITTARRQLGGIFL